MQPGTSAPSSTASSPQAGFARISKRRPRDGEAADCAEAVHAACSKPNRLTMALIVGLYVAVGLLLHLQPAYELRNVREAE